MALVLIQSHITILAKIIFALQLVPKQNNKKKKKKKNSQLWFLFRHVVRELVVDMKRVGCTHREKGQGLACALQQAVNSVGVSWVESLFQESLLHHKLHQLLPPIHCLQHPQARHNTHQQHKLFSRHILQHLRMQQGRDGYTLLACVHYCM